MSKASNPRRFDTSDPSAPRYGPASIPNPTSSAPDLEVERIAAEITDRRNRRDHALQETFSLWGRIDNPQSTDDLVVESTLQEEVVVMMRRGGRFAELAPSIGINQATKRARGYNQTKLKSFAGGAEQFADAINQYNLKVIELRSRRPPVSARKRRRPNLPWRFDSMRCVSPYELDFSAVTLDRFLCLDWLLIWRDSHVSKYFVVHFFRFASHHPFDFRYIPIIFLRAFGFLDWSG